MNVTRAAIIMAAIMTLSGCSSSGSSRGDSGSDFLFRTAMRGLGQKMESATAGTGLATAGRMYNSGINSMADQAIQESQDRRAQLAQAQAQAQPEPQSPSLPGKKTAAASGCFAKLAGKWRHAVGGTWTFNGAQATLVLNSTNYGERAQQITVLDLSSCDNSTMTYKIVRAALINTVDPSMAYDKTPTNAPSNPQWSKVHTQAYSLSGASLKFGNYTYTKL